MKRTTKDSVLVKLTVADASFGPILLTDFVTKRSDAPEGTLVY